MRGGLSAHDLVKAALDLTYCGGNRPRQANLLRAVSTAYYAMFHCLARCCADTMIGGPSAVRSKPAWQQVYRSLEHGAAKTACTTKRHNGRNLNFPPEIEDFANLFRTMQEKRHKADYDPLEVAYKSGVLLDINQVKIAIDRFEAAPLKDRRAFAAWVLFKPPRA